GFECRTRRARRWETRNAEKESEPGELFLRLCVILSDQLRSARHLLTRVEDCGSNSSAIGAAPSGSNTCTMGCFLNRFAGGESYANCDGSTTKPALNVLDFLRAF